MPWVERDGHQAIDYWLALPLGNRLLLGDRFGFRLSPVLRILLRTVL
jgi:hypothetical protein